jgi:hypothetical protein
MVVFISKSADSAVTPPLDESDGEPYSTVSISSRLCRARQLLTARRGKNF